MAVVRGESPLVKTNIDYKARVVHKIFILNNSFEIGRCG